MKNIILLLIFTAAASQPAFGQQTSHNRPSAGFQLQNLNGDFGIGLHGGVNVISPWVHLRFAVAQNWLEHLEPGAGAATWTGYQNYRLGLGGRYKIEERVFCYSEGGVMMVSLPSSLASDRNGFGGYGLFGFEFMLSRSSAYFLEAGGNGLDAVADKAAGKPIVGNGFTLHVGYRVLF